MLPFLLSLRKNLTLENREEILAIAQTVPVFGFLHSHNCGHCKKVYPVWDELSILYENSPSILLVNCDCAEDKQPCEAIINVTGFPTFFVTFQGQLHRVHPERTLERFIMLIETLRSFDPTLPCPRYFAQEGNFPLIAISMPDDDQTACGMLESIAQKVPRAAGHLQLALRGEFKAAVTLSAKYASEFEPIGNLETAIVFVKDHLHLSMSNWSMQEVDEILWRRAGFLIYTDERDVARAHHFGMMLSDIWCFGLMPWDRFQVLYPRVVLQDSDLPAIAILNREHTKFGVITKVDFRDETQGQFEALANGTDVWDTTIPFEKEKPPAKVESDGTSAVIWNLIVLLVVSALFAVIVIRTRRLPRALVRCWKRIWDKPRRRVLSDL
jgi:thiol-disulfide isomerase/thioredoxin